MYIVEHSQCSFQGLGDVLIMIGLGEIGNMDRDGVICKIAVDIGLGWRVVIPDRVGMSGCVVLIREGSGLVWGCGGGLARWVGVVFGTVV